MRSNLADLGKLSKAESVLVFDAWQNSVEAARRGETLMEWYNRVGPIGGVDHA